MQTNISTFHGLCFYFSNNYWFCVTLLGEVVSHNEYFKNCRNKWVEHFVMKTTKTVIRLEKLLNNLPQDPNKRKGIIFLKCVGKIIGN